MSSLRFKVHAIIQMEDRDLDVEDIRTALANGDDIEAAPDDDPYPARLVLGLCWKPVHWVLGDAGSGSGPAAHVSGEAG